VGGHVLLRAIERELSLHSTSTCTTGGPIATFTSTWDRAPFTTRHLFAGCAQDADLLGLLPASGAAVALVSSC